MIVTGTMRNLYKEVKENWRDWKWWKARYKDRILGHILHNDGTYVVDEDWDNLVILDSCRYDVYEELNTIKGKLESRLSRGSSSEEFLVENFRRHPFRSDFKDIVYVAANPYVSLLVPDKFLEIYRVWDYGWDNDSNTVSPRSVVEDALRARMTYPDKRLIAHFLQPHEPFLGARFAQGTGIREHRKSALKNIAVPPQLRDLTPWDLLERGELDRKQVWSAYRDNLATVLMYVKDLIAMLPGRSVVTSDHGNLFGERPHILYPFREFGHPSRMYVKQLVIVPWLIVDRREGSESKKKELRCRERKDEIIRRAETSKKETDKIRERLRALGYLK